MRELINKAMKLVLKARKSRDVKTKDEVLDGIWEILVNLDYETRSMSKSLTPSEN